jgi:signal transduction histidine kinase
MTSLPASNYPETIRFALRYLAAWALAFLAGGVLLWAFAGFNERLVRFAWAFATIGTAVAVAYLIGHVARVKAIAGYVDESVLRSRHRRTVELPCAGAEEAIDLIEATLRTLRLLSGVDIDREKLLLAARIRNVDRYAMDMADDAAHWVQVRLIPEDCHTLAECTFSPERAAWKDWWLLDYGRNLENAMTVCDRLKERIAQRRREDRAAAERAALEKDLAQARLRLLEAQVEPHFLYNTLSNAQALTRTDPARAELMLGHLIAFLRCSLPGGVESESTLGAEVERARAYLEILRIRMGSRLTVEIDVPSALHAIPMPALMLQTLVENAIKHGLEPKPGGGTIWIRAVREGPLLRLSVADNGVGFQEGTAGTGIGLANLKGRLRLAHGGAASLTLAANFPSGVSATLTLPIDASAA